MQMDKAGGWALKAELLLLRGPGTTVLQCLASCEFNLADIFGMGSLPEEEGFAVCCLVSTRGMDVVTSTYLVGISLH